MLDKNESNSAATDHAAGEPFASYLQGTFLSSLRLYRNHDGAASIRVRMVSGVFWALCGSIVSQGSTFLCSLVPARMLGVTSFGKLALIQSTMGMLAGFSGMGLGATATKFVSEYRGTDKDKVGRILGLSAVCTAITGALFSTAMILLAPILAERVFNATDAIVGLRIGALYIFFFSLNVSQVGAMSGLESFSILARLSIWQSAATFLVTLILTWWLGLIGAVLSLGIGSFFSWALFGIALRKELKRNGIRIAYFGILKERKVLSGFTIPAAISGMIGGIVLGVGSSILARRGGGFAEVAVFGAANSIRSLILFAPGLVNRVTTPILCNLLGDNESSRYRKTFRTGFLFSGGIAFLACLTVVLFSRPILHLFGKEFVQGGTVVALICASAVLEVLSANLFQIVYSHGRIWTHLGIMCVWSVSTLVGAWVLTPGMGAGGLAATYCFAWLIALSLYGAAVRGILVSNPAS